MKKKWLILTGVVLLTIAAVCVIVVKRQRTKSVDQSNELIAADVDEESFEKAKELFCGYMSADDWPNDPFFVDMVEAYNAFLILNGLRSVNDEWRRFTIPEDAIEALDNVDLSVIRDDSIRKLFHQCIVYGRELYEEDLRATDTLSNHIIDSMLSSRFDLEKIHDGTQEISLDDFTGYQDSIWGKRFQDSILYCRYRDCLYDLDSFLTVRFNVSNYVEMNDEKYFQVVNFAKDAEDLGDIIKCPVVTSENVESKVVKKDVKRIMKKIENEKDFNIKCAYAMGYVYHMGFWYSDVNVIEPLLDEGRYSHYLFFLWRIWRCGVQLCSPDNYGPSTWSEIPNKRYNEKRYRLAVTILKYIEGHRDDAVAINNYLMIASLPNIMRDGMCPIGNESFTELMYMGLHGGE